MLLVVPLEYRVGATWDSYDGRSELWQEGELELVVGGGRLGLVWDVKFQLLSGTPLLLGWDSCMLGPSGLRLVLDLAGEELMPLEV